MQKLTSMFITLLNTASSMQSYGRFSFYLYNTSRSVLQKRFQKLQSLSCFHSSGCYLIGNLGYALYSILTKSFQWQLHLEGYLDARFLRKLKSPTASITNCWARAGKGGIICPFTGGGMPHPSKLSSFDRANLIGIIYENLCLLTSTRQNKLPKHWGQKKETPLAAAGSLRYVRCP